MLECGERGRRFKGVSASAQAAQECYPARVASHRRAGGDSGGIGREYLQKHGTSLSNSWSTLTCLRMGLGDNPVLSRPVEISKIGAPTTACPCSRAKRPGPRRTAARRRPCGPTTADRGSGKVGSSRGCAQRRFEKAESGAGSSGLSNPYRGEIPPLSGDGAVAAEEAKSRQKVSKQAPV